MGDTSSDGSRVARRWRHRRERGHERALPLARTHLRAPAVEVERLAISSGEPRRAHPSSERDGREVAAPKRPAERAARADREPGAPPRALRSGHGARGKPARRRRRGGPVERARDGDGGGVGRRRSARGGAGWAAEGAGSDGGSERREGAERSGMRLALARGLRKAFEGNRLREFSFISRCRRRSPEYPRCKSPSASQRRVKRARLPCTQLLRTPQASKANSANQRGTMLDTRPSTGPQRWMRCRRSTRQAGC